MSLKALWPYPNCVQEVVDALHVALSDVFPWNYLPLNELFESTSVRQCLRKCPPRENADHKLTAVPNLGRCMLQPCIIEIVPDLPGSKEMALHRWSLKEVAHVRVEQCVVFFDVGVPRGVPTFLAGFLPPLRNPARSNCRQ